MKMGGLGVILGGFPCFSGLSAIFDPFLGVWTRFFQSFGGFGGPRGSKNTIFPVFRVFGGSEGVQKHDFSSLSGFWTIRGVSERLKIPCFCGLSCFLDDFVSVFVLVSCFEFLVLSFVWF